MVSVSGIHVGPLCSFYKRNSCSANITKLCGLDGLSSKLYFVDRLLKLSSPGKIDNSKRINLPISLLPCVSKICERTGFSLSIFVQIICLDTTCNFYTLQTVFRPYDSTVLQLVRIIYETGSFTDEALEKGYAGYLFLIYLGRLRESSIVVS